MIFRNAFPATAQYVDVGRVMTDVSIWDRALTELGVIQGTPAVFASDIAHEVIASWPTDRPMTPFTAARLVAEYLERIDEIR